MHERLKSQEYDMIYLEGEKLNNVCGEGGRVRVSRPGPTDDHEYIGIQRELVRG